jgi:hypothetical protein
MGQPKPKTSDPFFTPPQEGTPGRGRPYLDPPAFKPGGDQQPPQGQPPQTRPSEPVWKPKGNTPGWDSRQPFTDGGQQQPGQPKQQEDPLSQAIGSKSKFLVEARDYQRGSTTSKALIAGTASGLFAEPLVKGMGIAADKGAALEGNSLFSQAARGSANLWKTQIDPIGIHSSQIAKEESMVTSSFQAITKSHSMDAQLLEKMRASAALLPEEQAHLKMLKQGLKIGDDAKVVEVLMERQAHIDPNALKALNAAETTEHLSKIRALELSRGGDILTKAERGLLETRSLALTNVDKLKAAADGAKVESKWFTLKGAWENGKRSFFSTLGTGIAIETDHSVRDRMYGKGAPSWETSGFTVPLAIAVGETFKSKAGLAIGAVAVGHLIDNASPITPWVPDSFKHFTAFDAVPLGLAFAIPTKGKIAKTALIGTAVLLGNGAESAFMGSSPGDVEDRAMNISKQDKGERTYSSFEKAVEGFRDLGKKNEVILEKSLGQMIVDSNKNYKSMSQEDKLGAHRTTAAMAQALGDHHLENGTRLNVGSESRPTYILDGLNLDMGGDALMYLQMARNSVNGSKTMTEILLNKDASAYGSKVSQQEITDLNKVGDKVQANINAITGKHDLQQAMTKLSAFLERGTTASGATLNKDLAFHKTFVEDLNAKLGRNWKALYRSNGEMNPDAALLVSKLLRDQALAKLAQTAYKLEHNNDPNGAGQYLYGTDAGRNEWLPGSDKPKGYDGAMQCILMAERIDPNNPDLPELKAIASRLHEEVQAKEPSQYSNYKTNPLGVRR